MAKMKLFNEYSDTTKEVFKEANSLKVFQKLCVDTAKGKVEKYSIGQANDIIRDKVREICGLSENPSEREVRKAFRKSAVREAVFEVIESTIDDTLLTGWGQSPFFNKYVELKSELYGNKNQFYTKDDCVLTVSKIADGHHNLERQRLGKGTTKDIPVATYGAKVYMEMLRFVQGVEDWMELVDAISTAFTKKVNEELHETLYTAGSTLPVPTKWNIRGELKTSNHATFKKLISDVQSATGSVATIVGTAVALSGLCDMGNVNWISEKAKEDVYTTGRIGTFEGTQIVEIPQAFVDNTLENYVAKDDKLLIMPNNVDKFIKMFYEGSDEILEVSEVGDNGDDTKEYEFKTRFGIGALTNVRFGTWTIGE